MNVRDYVDNLFRDYQDSADMADFKEEVCCNLQERIDYLIKKGVAKEEAFKKATAELGDISEAADQIGNYKRKEVIADMYMKTKSYMKTWQKISYTVAGGLLTLGIIFTLVSYFATGSNPLVGIATLIPFLIIPVCGFVFLGLTQETARNYPMSWKRALFYVASVAVILFGLIIFALMFFTSLVDVNGEIHAVIGSPNGMKRELHAVIATLIPFFLPGSVVLAFLILTEKSRHKPWVVEQEAAWAERMKEQFADPYAATRFGLFSGALWIFAIALFVALGFMIGFGYSWLVFLLAVAVQMLIQASMMPKNKK